MFNQKLKQEAERQGLTARQLCAILNDRGIKVALKTVRSWVQGVRTPKPHVQTAVLKIFTS